MFFILLVVAVVPVPVWVLVSGPLRGGDALLDRLLIVALVVELALERVRQDLEKLPQHLL